MKNFLRFLALYRPYKWYVACGILLSLVTVFAGICLLAVSGWFIAAMGIAGAASLSMNYFTPAAMIRGLAILRTAGRYGERVANHDAALRVTSTFREWFYNRLEPLAPAGLSDLHSADMFSRLRGDIDVLERFYLNGIVPLCTALLAFLMLGAGLAVYHPPLALLELSLLFLSGILIPLMLRRHALQDEAVIAQEKIALNIDLAEMMHGMGEHLVYGRMDDHTATIMQHDAIMSLARKTINRRECIIQSVILLASGVAVTGAIYLVTPLVISGAVGPAQLAMAALFCLACFDIVMPLPAALQSLQAARIAAQRIFDIADRPVPATSSAPRHTSVPASGVTLSVENISFAYTDEPVLRDLSFTLPAGQVLVLSGRSGAGKSTVLDLLLGFHCPATGTMFFNDMNGDHYDAEARRSFFATASQKPYFFADTLRANLTLGNPVASAAEIEHACNITGLQDVITTLPEGLDTYIGEHGARLSGGQLRRAALARALLRPAPILLLDEPAEGLDPELEYHVMKAVLNHARQRGHSVILCLHDAQKDWLLPTVKTINFGLT